MASKKPINDSEQTPEEAERAFLEGERAHFLNGRLGTVEGLKRIYRREPAVIAILEKCRIAMMNAEVGDDFQNSPVNDVLGEVLLLHSGMQILKASREGDAGEVRRLRSFNAPVNFQDPRTGATPLHFVAAFRARAAFRALTKGAECDYLIRDGKGRLAWELAVDAGDAAMARLLVYKTRKQAEAADLPFPPRRPPAEIPTPR